MSYENGCPVFNSKDYSISYISHALGYYPRDINKSLEATKSSSGWELPKHDISETVHISNYAKLTLKTRNLVKVMIQETICVFGILKRLMKNPVLLLILLTIWKKYSKLHLHMVLPNA